MRYVVAGATGPVGMAIVRALVADDQDVTVLSRRPELARRSLPAAATIVPWQATSDGGVADAIRSADVVINLAGASIGSRPWTSSRKRDILASRVAATEAIVDAFAALPPTKRPSVLINASGLDCYGDRPDGVMTETSPLGDSVPRRGHSRMGTGGVDGRGARSPRRLDANCLRRRPRRAGVSASVSPHPVVHRRSAREWDATVHLDPHRRPRRALPACCHRPRRSPARSTPWRRTSEPKPTRRA